MILNLDYKSGHGHMTVDLDKFLPASLAQWRKLVRVMNDSYPDPREEVKAYLVKRYDEAKDGIAVHEARYAIGAATQVLGAERAKRLRSERDTYKRGSEKYKALSREIKYADASARCAGAKVRDAVAKGKALKKYVDKYPDYMRILWE